VAFLHFVLDFQKYLLYDLDMPSLTAKVIDGKTYYYARYCQRVGGKPKIVRQVYLGKIEDLVATSEASRQPPQPLETDVADVAALFDIAQRLELVPLLDSILPAKRHQGLSVGQYLLCWRPSIAPWLPPANSSSPIGTSKPS
jgi:hypothetical protein